MPGWKRFLPEFLGGYPKDYGNRRSAGTTHCAEFSNKQSREFGIRTVGDAWNRYPDKGFKSSNVIDGFRYTKDQVPDKFNQGRYDKYLNNTADSVAKYIDMTKIKHGDVVSMYYSGSPNGKKAFENGKVSKSTHTGNVLIEDGIPYVEHNVGGTVVKNRLKDVLGGGKSWGVTQVTRIKK